MKLKTLKSIKTILNTKRSSLPILDCFFIDPEYLYFTDLQIQVKVKHLFPLKKDSERLVVRADHFIQRMENIKAPFFLNCDTARKITFEQPEGTSIMRSEEANDFSQKIDNTDPQSIFTLSAHEINIMDIAAQFTADDELRPAMQTVCVGTHFVVASDAHMLYYKKIQINENIEVLFDKKVIKLMMLFPGQSFKISKLKTNLIAESEDITIWWRSDLNNHIMIDYYNPEAKKTGYPNWRSVLPTPQHIVIIPVKETIKALESIWFAVNKATCQIRCNIKGNKLTVFGKDLDYDLLASDSVNIINPDNNEIEYGMKYQFLKRILKCMQDEGYAQISVGYIDCTRAFIFGDQILCMPMMLNE